MSIPDTPPRINMALFRTDSLGSPLLPTSWDGSSRSFGRRVSYSLKSRANRYALRITVALTLGVLVFLYATTQGQSGDVISVYENLTNNGKLHLYTRDKHGDAQQHMEEEEVDLNGLSLLLGDLEAEDELLSEDALWITSYDESKILAEETEEERLRNEQHMMDIKKHDSQYALSAIAWFLSEGGILPHDFVVPSKETISRIGGRGFERMLNKLDLGENGESIFQDGWADYARKQYRVIVFSKVSLFKEHNTDSSLTVHSPNGPRGFWKGTVSHPPPLSSNSTFDVSVLSTVEHH